MLESLGLGPVNALRVFIPGSWAGGLLHKENKVDPVPPSLG